MKFDNRVMKSSLATQQMRNFPSKGIRRISDLRNSSAVWRRSIPLVPKQLVPESYFVCGGGELPEPELKNGVCRL